MADEDLKMKKRSREEHNLNNHRIDDNDDERSFKKINLNLNPSSSGSNSPPPPPTEKASGTGVFDFPWMNQGSMKTDLKFEEEEDAFALSIHTPSVSEIFGDDDRFILTKTTTEDRSVTHAEEKDVVNDGDNDGLECFWDSLLSQQPLSNIEFAAGGLF